MTNYDDLNVSRETFADLEAFVDLLIKWNAKINLVSPKSIDEVWVRHIADSTQVFDLIPENTGIWADFGTGGGFPGLVCAILAKHQKPGFSFVFVESDTRKSLFLRTAIRELGLAARVENARIETAKHIGADIITARALAPLSKLLEFSKLHLNNTGYSVFMKGANYRQEIEEALAKWQFQVQNITSKTDADAVVLKINGVERV